MTPCGIQSYGVGGRCKPLDSALLDQLINHLSLPYSNHDYDDVWGTFLLLEAKGFDVSMMRAKLHFRITQDDQESNPFAQEDGPPWVKPVSYEEERCLVLGLRQRARGAAGLPPLDGAQQDAWEYPEIEPIKRRREPTDDMTQEQARAYLRTPEPPPSEEEADAALQWVEGELPELLRAYQLIRKVNAGPRLPGDRPRLGGSWVNGEIYRAIANHRTDLGSRALRALSNAVWAKINS